MSMPRMSALAATFDQNSAYLLSHCKFCQTTDSAVMMPWALVKDSFGDFAADSLVEKTISNNLSEQRSLL